MPRTPARTTQADIARAIRAAKAAGAGGVDVLPDGRIRILLGAPAEPSSGVPGGGDDNVDPKPVLVF